MRYTCPDILQRFTTFQGNPFINQATIYWHLQDITTDFEGVKVIEAFRGAFSTLQPYFHPIRFESTSNINQANIIVHFAVNGDADLPIPFPQNVLAYAFSPVNNKSHVWFNDEREWAEMHQNGKYNLKKVAVHEFLHSLGLGHSDPNQFPGDILNPSYNPNNNIIITGDTVAGIDFLYGELKESLGGDEEPEEPTTPPDSPDEPTEPDCPECPDCEECPECPEPEPCPECPEPEPCPDIDEDLLKEKIKEIFKDKRDLKRLREESVVAIGLMFGLPVDTDKYKKENIEIVSNHLKIY